MTLCQGSATDRLARGLARFASRLSVGEIYRAELAWPDSRMTVSVCLFRVCSETLLGYLIGRVRSGAVSSNQTSL